MAEPHPVFPNPKGKPSVKKIKDGLEEVSEDVISLRALDKTKKKKAPNPGGRKPKTYDPEIFKRLCEIHCTQREIESVLGGRFDSINNWCKKTFEMGFADSHKYYMEGGKASLRRSQFKLSQTNATMAIWLGKQYLGQRDIPQEIEEFNGKLAKLLQEIGKMKPAEKNDQSAKSSSD